MDFITDAPAVLEAAISKFFVDEEVTLGEMIRDIKIQTDDLARRITIEVLEQMDKRPLRSMISPAIQRKPKML